MTQKYDMVSLRALQRLEEDIPEEIASLMGCDADDLDLDLDLIYLYNTEENERKKHLQAMLSSVSSKHDLTSLINRVLLDIEEIKNKERSRK